MRRDWHGGELMAEAGNQKIFLVEWQAAGTGST
jgi:hypothetical protein